MALFVLDTDYITLLQRGHPRVVEQFNATPEDAVAASIVTYEEQLRGRLVVIRQSKSPARLAVAYLRLREMQDFFCAIRLLDFDAKAAAIYETLRQTHRGLSAMDLHIAATTLAAGVLWLLAIRVILCPSSACHWKTGLLAKPLPGSHFPNHDARHVTRRLQSHPDRRAGVLLPGGVWAERWEIVDDRGMTTSPPAPSPETKRLFRERGAATHLF